MTSELLWTPLRLGPVTVANRVVFSAHLTNYAEDGRPSEQHAAYYAERARGGAGLIITEEHTTHPADRPYEKLIQGFRADVLPGYRRITDAVHAHGTPIFAQLNHNGGQASSMYSRRAVWAPSPVADPLFREVPKAVSHAEIAEIVQGYVDVAERCAEGGFDGIEVQCSHSSIVRGFLSPTSNRRTDEYGGSLENRARLMLELIDAVRAAIGPGLALGVRLCGDELIEGGTRIDEAVRFAGLVEATGALDYLNTSIGVATSSLFTISASMHVPRGYASYISSAFRAAISLPVVGVGRFTGSQQAERALQEGHCDLVGVVRGQIADADFVMKSRSVNVDDVRVCMSCNQECVGRVGLNRWLGCIQNPRTGWEISSVGLGRPSSYRTKVLIAGAGPAGLQAAIAASRNGHDVTVCERDAQAGGQLRLAASVPNRAELGDLVRNQLAEARQLGVTLEFGVELTADEVMRRGADSVIVATGAHAARPPWAPAEADRIVDIRDVLAGVVEPSGDVVVIDDVGFHHATSVAELLADRGCRVEVITPGMVVGQDLGLTLDMERWWLRASAKGITQSIELICQGYASPDDGSRGTLQLQHHPTGAVLMRSPDWVVLAVPGEPTDSLYHELSTGSVPVARAGDCVAPRRAHAAVFEGERVGALIGAGSHS